MSRDGGRGGRDGRDGPDGRREHGGSEGRGDAGRARFPLDPVIEVMDRLLGPGGCPWDREQDHQSLRPYVIEEAYEVVGAIDSGDPRKLKDELGDLLLQVVFHAALASREGQFDANDVVEAITTKLIRRHPHVFGDARASSPDAVLRQWEDIKKQEAAAEEAAAEEAATTAPDRASAGTAVGAAPKAPKAAEGPAGGRAARGAGLRAPRIEAHLPALMQAQKLLERASRLGRPLPAASLEPPAGAGAGTTAGPSPAKAPSDPGPSGPREAEIEFGKVLLSVLEAARRRGIDAELALRQACAELARELDQARRPPGRN